jgi:diacylglycerol kinase
MNRSSLLNDDLGWTTIMLCAAFSCPAITDPLNPEAGVCPSVAACCAAIVLACFLRGAAIVIKNRIVKMILMIDPASIVMFQFQG